MGITGLTHGEIDISAINGQSSSVSSNWEANRLLEGQTGLVVGVSNKRSIAWGIAQVLAGAGARLAFTYRARVGDRVKGLAATMPGSLAVPYDVQNDQEIQAAMDQVDREFGGLDILVHSVAFAPRDALASSLPLHQ